MKAIEEATSSGQSRRTVGSRSNVASQRARKKRSSSNASTRVDAGPNNGHYRRGRLPAGTVRYSDSGNRQGRRADRRAMTVLYSTFVGFMKWLLPVLAISLVLLVALWGEFSVDDKLIKIEAININPAEAETVNMQDARYQGVDSDAQRYNLRAIAAVQSQVTADAFELDRPEADMELNDGSWLAVNADTGNYDRSNRVLDLFGTVTVYHDHGHEMVTQSARLDLDSGEAVSETAVTGQSPLGTLTAEGFKLEERGEVVIFTGKSKLVLYRVDGGLGSQ